MRVNTLESTCETNNGFLQIALDIAPLIEEILYDSKKILHILIYQVSVGWKAFKLKFPYNSILLPRIFQERLTT